MGGDAAHLHPASAGDRPGGEGQPQQRGGGFSVIAVHLKEVAHLKQDNIVRVRRFCGVVVIHSGNGERFSLRYNRGTGRFHARSLRGRLCI